jgi:hypothetical protein
LEVTKKKKLNKRAKVNKNQKITNKHRQRLTNTSEKNVIDKENVTQNTVNG